MKALKPQFFQGSTLQIARKLLGTYLAHYSSEGLCIGKIVETEAYLQNDAASHAFKGPNARNAAMFGPAGRAYIYFIYGMYHCFNVSTRIEGKGEAVLIRALEPILGIELMKKRREKKRGRKIPLKDLCNGPGKLVIAMGIHAAQNHFNLLESELLLLPRNYFGKAEKMKMGQSPRIGISQAKELHYRFYLEKNPFISKHKTT